MKGFKGFKTGKLFALAALCAAAAVFPLFLSACGKTEETPETFALNIETYTLDLCETVVLTPVDADGNELTLYLFWESADESVAAVSNGTVTGLTAGETVITAVRGKERQSCVITVENRGFVPILSVNAADIPMTAGATFLLEAGLSYKGVPRESVFSFAVSDKSIIAVAPNGRITALTAGEAFITVSAVFGSFDAVHLTKTVEVRVI